MVESKDNLEELEGLLEQYCEKEYKHNTKRPSGKNLTLYSVDCGGYDIDGSVTFNIKDGEFTLDIVTKRSEKNYQPLETKSFKFKLL